MNLPDAIERVRRMHSDAACRVKKFGGLMADGFPADVEALAVCLEALAEHAHDGGALLREVNPKAYSTLKSAPPLTPEERAVAFAYKGPELKCSCGKLMECHAQDYNGDHFRCACGVRAVREMQPKQTDWFPPT